MPFGRFAMSWPRLLYKYATWKFALCGQLRSAWAYSARLYFIATLVAVFEGIRFHQFFFAAETSNGRTVQINEG